jgi:hypothetical protein
MKFTVAWAKIASENSVLKGVILCLSTLCLFFGIASLKLAMKDPIVVERGCYSRAVPQADGKRTTAEVEAFLTEALSQRFDTQAVVRNDYLSDDEQLLRAKEQRDLQSRKLVQRVILNSATVEGGSVKVNADRLISVGEIRSVFRFPLQVKIESITRTAANPYGLIVSEVKSIEKGDK